jgi:catechol 2,3-dioxygenase-like lactoylglutathione lyase family enzyme
MFSESEGHTMKLIELAWFTENIGQMTDFYCTLLGAGPLAQSDDMAIFLTGETKIFLHRTYQPSEGELPPNNHIAFGVEDVDAACETLVKQGLMLEVPPRDYYWGRSAYLRDPDGRQIEITKANL